MILSAQPLRQPLLGEIELPGDKSISHRSVLFNSLATGQARVRGFLRASDTLGTVAACRQLGVEIVDEDGELLITGRGLRGLRPAAGLLDVGNSGTAMRLMAGMLAAQDFSSELGGDDSLSRRPMGRVIRPLREMGGRIEGSDGDRPPLRIQGGAEIRAIEYDSAIASAQVKSCLMLAALVAGVPLRYREPETSRDHSERLLAAMGLPLDQNGEWLEQGTTDALQACDIDVPGDPSSAAFLAVAAACGPDGSEVLLRNCGINPTRNGLFDLLQRMGAEIDYLNQREMAGEPVADLRVRAGAPLRAIEFPPEWAARSIDEIPILMVAAAMARGTSRIRGVAELRVKESDRLKVMCEGLRRLGVTLEEFDDGVHIEGGDLSARGQGEAPLDGAGDHRCAMSLLVAGSLSESPLRVAGCELIGTSWPEFQASFNRLGGRIDAA